jgi:hypothetical protein
MSDGTTQNLPSGYTNGQNGNANDVFYRWSYKFMGSTPDTTATGLSSSSVHIAMAFRGVNTTTPLDATSPTRATNTSGMPNPPSITTVTANAWVIAMGYLDDDLVTATAPTNFTLLRTANYGSSGAGGTVMAARREKTTAGAEDPGVFGGGGTDAWVGTTAALRPASGGGSAPTGAQGAQGARGPQGASGTGGVQGAQGARGPQGAQGAQGAQGQLGPQGFPGPQGVPTGAQGAAGGTGGPGAQGAQGAQGGQGSQGSIGPTGAQGSQGFTGAQGAAGPPGQTCFTHTDIGLGGNLGTSCSASPITMYSNESVCATAGATFYFDLTNCQNITADYSSGGGLARLACQSTALSAPMTIATGVAGTFASCSFSDFRLKRGIETLSGSLEKINKLQAVEYDWNKNVDHADYLFLKEKNKLHSIGLIAQDVRKYYPEVVKLNSNGYYYIEYTKLNAALVEAIKEQQYLIEDINEKIKELEYKLI